MPPDALKTARRSRGMTQEQMAAQLGVSRVTYNGWETGKAARGVPARIEVAVLALLGATEPPKPDVVDWICPDTAPQLYHQSPTKVRNHPKPDHPCFVLDDLAHQFPELSPGRRKWPLAILEWPEYQARLAKRRAAQASADAHLKSAGYVAVAWAPDSD